MTISIDWDNKIISISKSSLILTQSIPIEIFELNVNQFHLDLKSLEYELDGIVYLDTHKHNTTVSVGGIEIARVVEIINDYTITFEDGSYLVNIIGGNSNIQDRVNPNNVSVRGNNSSGLIQFETIQPILTQLDKDEIIDGIFNADTGSYLTEGTFGHWINKKVLTIKSFLSLT